LYSALSAFYPELDTDADGKCVVTVTPGSEVQMLEITEAIQLHLADRGDDAVNTVSFVGNDQHGRRDPRLDDSPRSRLKLIVGSDGHALPGEDPANAEIHVMNADGRGQRNLTRTRNRHERWSAWSSGQVS
jgi:hypothetical protein